MFNFIEGVNLVYGEAATGKTTLAMQLALEEAQNGKVVFIDTENGFSTERIKQMNKDYEILLNNIIVFRVKNFKDQHELIKKLGKFNAIIMDTIGMFYRYEIKNNENKFLVNNMLNKQLRILSELKTKVLITTQVYSDMNNNLIPIGGEILKKWCNKIVKLEKDPRKILFEKPEENSVIFEISDPGFVF
ncbi:AAA family ATPase [archaeon]|nr:AAA family ATPase [archaeon]